MSVRPSRILRAIALFVAAGSVAAACTSSTQGAAGGSTTTALESGGQPSEPVSITTGGSVIVAMGSPEAISAHHAITPGALDIAALLHTGLTTRGANGLAEPGLAQSWSSIDQRTWIFNLAPGSLFNDGTEVTAQSFVDSWQTLATQDTRSRNAYLGLESRISGWAEVLGGEQGRHIGVRALDDVTLQVQLDGQFPWFPELVAHPAFAPLAAAELGSPNPSEPVGTGPFKLESPFVPGEPLRLGRVWETASSGSVSTFEFRFTDGDGTTANDVSTGRADIGPIGRATVAAPNVDVVATATDTLIYMGFPVSREPVDEPFIRQALVGAIDRTRIEQSAIGDASLSNAAFAPVHAAGANLLTCLACVYEPDRAREQLLEVELPANDLSVHVVTGSAGEPWADAIADAWRVELGWPVSVVRHDLAGLIGFLQAGIPDGPFILEWTSEYPAAESWLIPLFDRAGFDDFTRFSDREITSAFDALAAVPSNSANRATPLKDIRTVLAEQVPLIPLGVLTRRVAAGPSVDPGSIGSGLHLELDKLIWLP